jgi:hypothetical protein
MVARRKCKQPRVTPASQLHVGGLVATVRNALEQQVRQAELQVLQNALQGIQLRLQIRLLVAQLLDCSEQRPASWPRRLQLANVRERVLRLPRNSSTRTCTVLRRSSSD